MLKKTIRQLITFVIFLVLWEGFSKVAGKPFFPGPVESFESLITLILDGTLIKHLGASTFRIFFGTLFGLLSALPVGLIMGCNQTVDLYLGNVFEMLYPIPKVVFLPIIVVCMGIGDTPKIFLIALVIFFQLALSIRDAVKHIPAEQIRSMKALDPTISQYLCHLVIPACLPEILSSLRGTLGISTALLFITENFASITGLGYYITKCMDAREFGDMYAGILTLAGLGVALYWILGAIEKWVCKWKQIETDNYI